MIMSCVSAYIFEMYDIHFCDQVMFCTCDILALIAAFESSVDVASIANRKRH